MDQDIKQALDAIKADTEELKTQFRAFKRSQDYYLGKAATIELSQEDNDREILSFRRDISELKRRVLELEQK